MYTKIVHKGGGGKISKSELLKEIEELRLRMHFLVSTLDDLNDQIFIEVRNKLVELLEKYHRLDKQ